jgi:3',5'-cyclic AMP phosphodiesterase CpdA
MRLAATADLHWSIRPAGDNATRQLVDFLRAQPPDVLILGGDLGAGDDFPTCLALFDSLDCKKALVPGNHDIWVEQDDRRGDSLQVYRDWLPRQAADHGFHYLDQGPLLFPEANLGLVGSINWYDYSWALAALKARLPDWEYRLRTKCFTRGRHNDARFVRWPLDDGRFTKQVAKTLEDQLQAALAQVGRALVITHHPAFQGLSFPRPLDSTSVDGLLWEAYSGNCLVEQTLSRFQDHIPLAFSGHTHRERENHLGPIRGFNIGGDYHFKRLLLVDWPAGTVQFHEFR